MNLRMGTESLAVGHYDDLAELAKGFRTGDLSIRAYLNKLETLFREKETLIHAFVTPAEDCFETIGRDLKRLEALYPEPSSRPPLYGIPVGVKDIFHVAGFSTQAGSKLPTELLQGAEAKAVTRLKSAGALCLGKTVTAEFACRAPGPTRNPHRLEHTPGGSSSGSAAAVAAGLCPLALGTQTAGSVIRPASYCGVVGFKPSYGRVSMEGVIPLAPSLDHAGFFTGDVEGAILTASLLCEGWRNRDPLPPLVAGVPEGPYLERASREGLNHFRGVCERLSEAGIRIRPVEMFQDLDEIMEHFSALVSGEAALVHQDWFPKYSHLYQKSTAAMIRSGQEIDSKALKASRRRLKRLRDNLLETMKQHGLSLFIAPSATGPAPAVLKTTGEPIMNTPWTSAGLPVITVPSGKSEDGLPLGLQMIGGWMEDERLLGMAEAIARILGPDPLSEESE